MNRDVEFFIKRLFPRIVSVKHCPEGYKVFIRHPTRMLGVEVLLSTEILSSGTTLDELATDPQINKIICDAYEELIGQMRKGYDDIATAVEVVRPALKRTFSIPESIKKERIIRMRIPDPEDSKYWYYDPRDLQRRFNEHKYIEDLRKWKAELQRRFKDIMAGPEDPWTRIQKIWSLLKEILGEELE